MIVEASAPGKVILFGEHSVVYKGPAIVLAINKRARVFAEKRNDDRIFMDSEDLGYSGFFIGDKYYPVKGAPWRGRSLTALNLVSRKTIEKLGVESGLNLKFRSEIPSAVGLGSSAAICVATAAAIDGLFGGKLSQEEICALAYEGEKVIHGRPSGVDNNVSTYGGVLKYEGGVDFEKIILEESPCFIIGNTKQKRSTGRMVQIVSELRQRNQLIVDEIIEILGKVSETGLTYLLKHDYKHLGELMDICHGLLNSLGVSTSMLDKLVHASRESGAMGAKLTGAGGGGCMIALVDEERMNAVEEAIRIAGGVPMRVDVSYEGVKTRRVD